MNNRFLFWGVGADFSLAVVDNLRYHNVLPYRIVLPDYPPGPPTAGTSLAVSQPAGRNRLADLADKLSIPLIYAPRQRVVELKAELATLKFEFMLVACWPYKIPAEICGLATKAAMNIHPSLLPAYRGADPVGDQIRDQEKQFGVSLHLLSDELDCGDIVASRTLVSGFKSARREIELEAAASGVEMFIEACAQFGGPNWAPQPQNRTA